MGRHFTLYTDHKPLVRLFDPKQATSGTAAARIQRLSLLLSNYDYTVEYKKGSNNSNADALSRLPLSTTHSTLEELAHVQVLQVGHINSTPIESKQIRIATINDSILSRVLGFVNNGWPNLCPFEELKSFYLRSTELTSEDHVLILGLRVVVPTKLRSSVLDLLHDTHRSCAHDRSNTHQSLVARYRQGHRANLCPMRSMLTALERSAEISIVSLGLPF